MTTDYAAAPALRARIMGVFLVLLGLVVCVATVLVLVLELPLVVLSAVVVVVLVAVFGGGHLLARRSYVVRTDDAGYRVRFVRGAGVTAARWEDVEDVVAIHVAGARCVRLRLRDGGSTTVPVDVLAVDGDQFARELAARLDQWGPHRRVR